MSETAGEAAERIRQFLPTIKPGTLRFYGNWFGRPHDNTHRIVDAVALDDCLIIHFDDGELLSVWQPQGLHISRLAFRIKSSVRVRWEWHSYGEPKTPEHLYFEEYVQRGTHVETRTNWPDARFNVSTTEPAVEMY